MNPSRKTEKVEDFEDSETSVKAALQRKENEDEPSAKMADVEGAVSELSRAVRSRARIMQIRCSKG